MTAYIGKKELVEGEKMILYHYRPIESALLEIEKGTFHFASREEQNDPLLIVLHFIHNRALIRCIQNARETGIVPKEAADEFVSSFASKKFHFQTNCCGQN